MNTENLKSFFSNRWVVIGIVAVVVFGGGYATGRYLAPPQTIVTEKIHEVEKQVVVEKVKTEIKVVTVHDAQTAEKVHRVVVETAKPDGEKTTTTTEDINTDTVVHDNTNSVQIQYVDRVVEKWSEKIIEKEKRVLKAADWRVAAGVGVAIPTFLGETQIGIPGLKGFVVQVEADRRIIGPFYLGLWGNTQGSAGLNLSAVF